MIPYVDWALVLVALGGACQSGERGRKEGEKEERRREGRVHHSTKRPRLLPGVLCSPSLKGDPHHLPEQMVFSEASQEGGKRRQKLDIHLHMCRAGEVRTLKPCSNPKIAYPSLPKAFPFHLLLLMLLLLPPPLLPLQSPPWGAGPGIASSPLGLEVGSWLVPLLLLVPLPRTRPSSSLSFLHLLPYQPAVPSPTGKGREDDNDG